MARQPVDPERQGADDGAQEGEAAPANQPVEEMVDSSAQSRSTITTTKTRCCTSPKPSRKNGRSRRCGHRSDD
jgi:hypothetical protein